MPFLPQNCGLFCLFVEIRTQRWLAIPVTSNCPLLTQTLHSVSHYKRSVRQHIVKRNSSWKLTIFVVVAVFLVLHRMTMVCWGGCRKSMTLDWEIELVNDSQNLILMRRRCIWPGCYHGICFQAGAKTWNSSFGGDVFWRVENCLG